MAIDLREALRYAGVPTPDHEMMAQMQRIADEISARCVPRYVLREFPLERQGTGIVLPGSGVTLTGSMAQAMLAECDRAALLVCTLGVGFDAYLRALRHRDMAAYVLADACGSAYVETGCDQAEQALRQTHPDLFLADRFSPGYGDLPLNVQPALLAATDAMRRLGVYLTPSNLMNPSKSVTAVIGLSHTPQRARIRGCAVCMLRGACAYRERGETCAT